MPAGRPLEPGAINRNPKVEWTQVEDIPYVSQSKPKRPSTRYITDSDGNTSREEFTSEAIAWWDTVSRMPHCVLWKDSDWLFAKATMLLVDDLWRGNSKIASEIRQREAKMGVTLESRNALRIKYVESKKAVAMSDTISVASLRQSSRARFLEG